MGEALTARLGAFVEFGIAVIGLCLFLLGIALLGEILMHDLSEMELLVKILEGI
jgi:hypothetical protein